MIWLGDLGCVIDLNGGLGFWDWWLFGDVVLCLGFVCICLWLCCWLFCGVVCLVCWYFCFGVVGGLLLFAGFWLLVGWLVVRCGVC